MDGLAIILWLVFGSFGAFVFFIILYMVIRSGVRDGMIAYEEARKKKAQNG